MHLDKTNYNLFNQLIYYNWKAHLLKLYIIDQNYHPIYITEFQQDYWYHLKPPSGKIQGKNYIIVK